MKVSIFSIYDSKAEAYLQPFFAPTVGIALRRFQAAAQDVTTDFHKFAGDYTLFQIGMFDDHNGEVINEVNANLGNAIEIALVRESNDGN